MYKEKVNEKIAESMKAKDQVMVDLWRAIKSEFLNHEKQEPKKDSKTGELIPFVLTDEAEFKIISKMLQQRKEDIDMYSAAGRAERVEVLQREYDTLQSMLPEEPSDEEITAVIDEFIAIKLGEVSMANMKEAQAYVKQKYAMANGGKIAQIFKNKLNK